MKHSRLDISKRGVATLTIANQTKLNVLDSETVAEMSAALRKLARDAELRALVIRGTGDKAFVGGANIHELGRLDADSAVAFISRLGELCEAVRDFPVPTIARIPGWCLGGGLEFAAACDLRLASTAARFGMPEVRLGIPSVIHANLLTRLIGEGHTRWLLLGGTIIDAERAERWGFLNEVVEPARLDEAIDQALEALLAGAPAAIRAQKALLQKWEDPSLERGLKESIAAFGASYLTGEPERYVREFLQEQEKRREAKAKQK